jgi:hypothetical protein
MSYDPNGGDLETVAKEISLAERFGKGWGCRFMMVPTHAYGVEWMAVDTESEHVRSLVFFELGQTDGPYLARASRLVRGAEMARALGTKLTAIWIRPAGSGHADLTDVTSVAVSGGVGFYAAREIREGIAEAMIEIPESMIKLFTKGN